MQRPIQVTVAGGLALVWAASCLVIGAAYVAGVLQLPTRDLIIPPGFDPATLPVFTGVAVMLGAALWAPIGIGLLRLKKWARGLALVFTVAGLLSNIPQVALLGASLGVGWFLLELLWIATFGVMMWLLVQAPVREAFGVGAPPQAAGPAIRERPAGVNFLTVVCVLGAIGSLTVGVLYALFVPTVDPSLGTNPETLRLVRSGMVGGVLPWVAGYTLCAIGLWRLRNWGRILAIVLAVFWLLPAALVAVMTVIISLPAPSLLVAAIMLVIVLLLAAIPGWTLWYLFRPRVKQAFGVS